jgi:dTDP-4-amino-4,6-dideoxygalactose transaminase
VTNLVTETALVLPLFYEMTEEEQDYVIDCLEQATQLTTSKGHCL